MKTKNQSNIQFPKIVNHAEWQKARDALLIKEKKATHGAMRWRPSAGGCRWSESIRDMSSPDRRGKRACSIYSKGGDSSCFTISCLLPRFRVGRTRDAWGVRW